MVSKERQQAWTSEVAHEPRLDSLCRVIAEQQRAVFHRADHQADQERVVAEQILLAEVQTAHAGDPNALIFLLDRRIQQGAPEVQVIQEFAQRLHSYYTTPLGVAVRKELFGGSAELAPDSKPRSGQARI